MKYKEALIHLRDNGPSDRLGGICCNVYHLYDDGCCCKYALQRGFASWPEFSGNLDYPVPDVTGKYSTFVDPARKAYKEAWHMWEGEYGAARRRLLDWLIEQAPENY